jgi:hypothetical protein
MELLTILQKDLPFMSDPIEQPSDGGSGLVRKLIFGALAVYIIFSLYFSFQLNQRLERLETKQKQTEQTLAATGSELKATTSSLADKVGMTQKELDERAAALQRQQRQTESRLSEEQKKQHEALGAVASEVGSVKTDVGGVKTDVASTKSELELTKAKLERTIGDLGIQSGLIATTREDLDVLKRRGERNYFEFTLQKNKTPTPVSTVSLQLKKADRKKGKYTLNVTADDRTIEKKDRNLNEPVQFYTGRDKMLYELVVFTVEKDKIAGYISTPKSAPQPVSR